MGLDVLICDGRKADSYDVVYWRRRMDLVRIVSSLLPCDYVNDEFEPLTLEDLFIIQDKLNLAVLEGDYETPENYIYDSTCIAECVLYMVTHKRKHLFFYASW